MLCICCLRPTQIRCTGCGVILCCACGTWGLCGLCVRMEQEKRARQMPVFTRVAAPPALILNVYGQEHWSAHSAQIKCNEETEYSEVN